jgi:hypothetical protein
MTIKFNDRASIGTVKTTKDGYLSAIARSLRIGIQEYHSSELGLIGDRIVKVMRPPESVFSKDSLASAVHIPVTLGHPPELVTADNWKEYAIGEVGSDVIRDGENIAFSLMVKDKDGLKAYEGGTREISMGYVADMQPAPDGADYDFIMGPPKYNHLAIVDKARAGSQARIGDTAIKWGAAPLTTKGSEMEFKTIVVGDRAVQVAVNDADVITKLIADNAALKVEISDRDAAIGEKMAEIVNLQSAQISDADIEALAETRASVIAKALKMVDGIETAGKSVLQIQREVVASRFGDERAANFPEAAIGPMFDFLDADTRKPDAVLDAVKEKKPAKDDPWADAFKKLKGK